MEKAVVQSILDRIKAIKGSSPFYDIHVHPLEVMYDPLQYKVSDDCSGLYSAYASEYVPPGIADLSLERSEHLEGRVVDKKVRAKFCLLSARKSYAHTGPKVFRDSMELSGINKVLMLPVMGEDECGDAQLEAMSEMFGNDERFIFGYCVPNVISNDEVVKDVQRVVSRYKVKVLKIHPSATGIDLTSHGGIERVEHILDASKKCSLTVLLHGGLSPDCKNSHAVTYGSVDNLQKIDWSITPETVVIAHGGCYGHSPEEARDVVIPKILRLTERHLNLAIDTSEIQFESLCCLLERFDSERIFFGSDAMYEKQWAALIRLWCAIEQTKKYPEAILNNIASINAEALFNHKCE